MRCDEYNGCSTLAYPMDFETRRHGSGKRCGRSFFFPHSGNGAAIQSGSPGWKVGQGQGQARGMSKSWSYAPWIHLARFMSWFQPFVPSGFVSLEAPWLNWNHSTTFSFNFTLSGAEGSRRIAHPQTELSAWTQTPHPIARGQKRAACNKHPSKSYPLTHSAVEKPWPFEADADAQKVPFSQNFLHPKISVRKSSLHKNM